MAKKYSVEIVVPIYNEAKELKTNILKLYTYLKKNLEGYNFHITIDDNASTDSSLTIAQALSKKYKEIGYIHLDLKGRGRAVKEAWQKSQADILSYMDVDLSTDLTNFLPMIDSLIKRGYYIAIGSRLLPNSKVLDRPLKREILSRGYNILIKLLFQVHCQKTTHYL